MTLNRNTPHGGGLSEATAGTELRPPQRAGVSVQGRLRKTGPAGTVNRSELRERTGEWEKARRARRAPAEASQGDTHGVDVTDL